MPNCFTLTRKGETEPARLQAIDDEMRVHFGAPPSETDWYKGWYDIIGFGLACGKTFDQIRDILFRSNCSELIEVTNWIEANFTPNVWAEVGRCN